MDAMPNDHDHKAMTPELPPHVGNTDDWPPRRLDRE